ncbi:MAG TPA: hypothetical protein PK397_07575 [Ignavibacteriaceae bacterium]|jgi:hypothetical protein|nr:hypothetical protein [Ignavibacteriaceae bacterium]
MIELKKHNLILDHRYDVKAKRHYLNGFNIVFHCHHYTTLYTQLAIDAGETELLAKVSEEIFLEMLKSYYEQHDVKTLEDRIHYGCQYYAAVGLGKMVLQYFGDDSGQVKLEKSHVDSGWIKKWGQFDKPVNFIGKGFVAALFAAINDAPISTFYVEETESIVMGAEHSIFRVVKK